MPGAGIPAEINTITIPSPMSELPSWLSGAPGQWLLRIHAQPGARTSASAGEHDGALKIRVAAPPVDGKANEALLRWLAGRLQIAQRDLELVAGSSARAKRIRINNGLSAERLRTLLLAADG